MDYEFNPSEAINYREMFIPKKRLEPAIDIPVSKIVGKKILTQDPRLIGLITKWKKQKNDDNRPDNFLSDPKKVEELKKVFNSDLC